MAQQKEKTHEKQQDKSPKAEKGFWSKAWNFAKDVISKSAGAVAGAAIGSAIPGVGTVAGFFIGLAVHLGVEYGTKFLMNEGEKAAEKEINTADAEHGPKNSTAVVFNELDLAPKPTPNPEIELSQAPQPKPGKTLLEEASIGCAATKGTKELSQKVPGPYNALTNPAATPRLAASAA